MTLDSLITWLIDSSVTSSILLLLILGVKIILGRWLSPRWHYLIWLLVFVRLVTPVGPEFRFSLSSLIITPAIYTVPQQSPKTISGYLNIGSIDESDAIPDSTAAIAALATNSWLGSNAVQILALLWAIGVLATLAIIVLQSRNVHQIIRSAKAINDAQVSDLFDECCTFLRVKQRVRMLQTEHLSYPALVGVFRPVVLIPAARLASCSMTELRVIILHELIHLRRLDLPIATLVALAQAAHWFNPIIWIVNYRMRLDREIACDAEVLTLLGTEQRAQYGKTLIDLAEQSCRPPGKALAGIGIVKRHSELRSRILKISTFKRVSSGQAFSGICIALCLGAVGLTKAQSNMELEGQSIDTVTTGTALEMPIINELPPGTPRDLNLDSDWLQALAATTRTSVLSTKPNNAFLDEKIKYRITVDEKDGVIEQTFDSDTSKTLLNVRARNAVVFESQGITINCQTLNYDRTTGIVEAEGPGLIVTHKDTQYIADKLVYWLESRQFDFQGNVLVIEIGQNGTATTTTGDRIKVVMGGSK